MKLVPVGDTVVQVGQTTPPIAFSVFEDDGTTPFDLTGFTADIALTDLAGTDHDISGTVDEASATITFAWGTLTAVPENYRSRIQLAGPGFSDPPFYGPTYLIYDPADLWVNPYEVEAIAGGDYTDTEVIRAIGVAQSIVRAWVSVPVQSPVPEPIRQATTLLAARALTLTTGGDGGHTSGRVVSETIADYTVRYADPGAGDYGMGGWIAPDIAALLAPYRGGVSSLKIGPASPYHPLPITDPLHYEYDDEYDIYIDPYRDVWESTP